MTKLAKYLGLNKKETAVANEKTTVHICTIKVSFCTIELKIIVFVYDGGHDGVFKIFMN